MKNRHSLRRIISVCAVCSLALCACGSKSDSHAPTPTPTSAPGQNPVLSDTIQDFELGSVTMLDEYCTNAFSKEIAYLLSFDNDKLLAGFRDNAGLDTKGATRYSGWENSLIGGHSVGHYLSAVAQAYTNPTLSETEKHELYNKVTTLIDELKICQDNSKGKPGFLWAASKLNAANVEFQFDNVELRKTNISTEAWVPWYTMHKLVAGLVDVYKYTDYAPAKDVASALGDWVYNRCLTWNTPTHNTVLSIEYGGMNDCMYDLYTITGNENHAIAAHYFDETGLFQTVQDGDEDALNNRHANTTIPKFMGGLKRYMTLNGKTIAGEVVDASAYLEYAKAFWEMVTTRHTYITGGNSEWEHFGQDYVLDSERTNCNCETCNSYNMLKLSRELYKITGDSKYIDFYETTYYNSILSSQNPETGMTTYFQPMATGYFKVYSSEFGHFWCCTGSGMESFTKLGDTIYMYNGNILYVNLYQSSQLNWEAMGVKVTQTSTIPGGNTASFTIDGNASLDLRLRLPDWVTGDATITVNGTAYTYKTVDGYAQVTGDFKTGDIVAITLPMEVVAYTLPDADNVYAFKYGPVVLSAELGTKDMIKGVTGVSVSIPQAPIVDSENISLTDENISVKDFMANINTYLVKDANSLKFTLTGTDTELTFSPHYLQYQQRYGIYWYFYDCGTIIDGEVQRAETVIVDTVQPGYGQYENDELHAMVEESTVGVTDDSTYRYAEAGGYFRYRMAVDETAPYTVLDVTFRKADNGKTIRISIGDTVLYADTLNYEGDEDTYSVMLRVPAEVISENVAHVEANGTSYRVVDVTFSANDDGESAKVCDFIYMTAVTPLYEYDDKIAYFVDCGDHDPTTTTGSDKRGIFNSLTEQLYGFDTVTGMRWGLIDDPTDKYGGAHLSDALYTANTWANEYDKTDGQNKAASFRYTKNQFESGIDRHLDYGFDLPNGTYTVEIGFNNPWNCSESPSVYANYGSDNQQTVAENIRVGTGTTVTGTVTVTDGTLTLHFSSDSAAINVTYITISFAE